MAITPNNVDNINNFTIAGKAQQLSDSQKAANSLVSTTQDFLKLLTVQLQNQDPTKPLETDQITQQIASLSQVEQQINTNKNLEKMMSVFTQSQISNAVSYIGKNVEAPGNLGTLSAGQATFVYTLEEEAKNARVTVSDPDGNVIYVGDGTKLAGRNTFVCFGKVTSVETIDGINYLALGDILVPLDKVLSVRA
jgi:flagellar basal-body rod modification protein FlgD